MTTRPSRVTYSGRVNRTKDLKQWELLPDLKTRSPQQRNVMLHPEFVDGKHAFYTRPYELIARNLEVLKRQKEPQRNTEEQ